MYEQILSQTEGPAAVISLHRPEANNAYTAQLGEELANAIMKANADDAIRAIVLTATGRHFCVGADMSAGASSFDTREGGAGAKNFGNRDKRRKSGPSFIEAMFSSNKPIITAFNGSAVGVGLTMTLPSDFMIAADTAKFGFVFARRGLPPEAGSAWFLPHLVGLRQALDWCLTGRVFLADEALKSGLLNDVVPPEALMTRALALVDEIASTTAPVSAAVARRLLWQFAAQDSPFDLLKHDGRLAMELGSSPDVAEGVTAFLEKRSPNFPCKVSTDLPTSLPILHDQSAEFDLTRREIQCLKWAALGKTDSEIANIVGIAVPTIRFHLTNAGKKLGVDGREQAVSAATDLGFVGGTESRSTKPAPTQEQ